MDLKVSLIVARIKVVFEKVKKVFRGSGLWRVSSVVLLAVVAIVGIGILLALSVYSSGKKLMNQTQLLYLAAKSQDLQAVGSMIPAEKVVLGNFSKSLGPWAWTKFLPIAGGYWSDLEHGIKAGDALLDAADAGVKAVMPYSDIIGLNGGNKVATSTQKAKDRIDFIVSTVGKLAPQLDGVGKNLTLADSELQQINTQRYPEMFQGKNVRGLLTKGITAIHQAKLVVGDARPVLEVAPWLLGNDKARTYLIIFQNDAELRPTGGFWTGYALLSVDKGQLSPLYSGDIYDLDARYSGGLRAPQPLINYIADPYAKEQAAGQFPYWRLRDMNLSPDFRVAVQTFLPEYLKIGSPRVDGVIAVDSQVLVSLLKVLGQVGVPGFGNFSADNDPRCNCPQVIYQLESIIGVVTPYMRPDRKGVLGPLMHSVLANAVASPKERMPGLFEAALNDVLQKHVLFYFPEANVQQAMESFNLAGRVREAPDDYLFVADSNMGGAKSNLYVQEGVSDTVEWNGSMAIHNLTINYKNPQAGDEWLNAPYRDWFRVYAPKGAKLDSSSGSETAVKQGEDLGKTTFEGFFSMRPLGATKLTLKYEVPLPKTADYDLLIQKQGGTPGIQYSVTLNGEKNDFALLMDKELRLVH